MHKPLVNAMENYFSTGLAMDVDALDGLYADDFENIRTDMAGRCATITKAQFMQVFRQMAAAGQSHGSSTDDVEFLKTSVYDDLGTVLLRRNENEKPVVYNFVWRLADGVPTQLVREFSTEEDISGLLAAMNQGQQ